MEKAFLVGSTGFVGSNLLAAHHFEGAFHAADVADAYEGRPDLLVYAGVPSEMFTAARNPAADLAVVEAAMENIRRIAPERVVLISTVAVYPEPWGVDEDTPVRGDSMNVYGRNRRLLESWVEETFSRRLVVRLPAIYGPGLKKNFIYDYIRLIPALLSENKLLELEGRIPRLREFYSPRGDGFFRCRELAPAEEAELKASFQAAGFTALRFTDSRSAYQFYPLRRLWEDIRRAEAAGLARVNLVPPPIRAGELYRELRGEEFCNELSAPPYRYDVRTRFGAAFGGGDGYVMTREEELAEIRRFIGFRS